MITREDIVKYEAIHSKLDDDVRICWDCGKPLEKRNEDYYKIVYTGQNQAINYPHMNMQKYFYVYFHKPCFESIAGAKYAFRIRQDGE